MSGNIIIQKENGFSANICTTKSSTPPSTSLRITFKPSAELFGKFGFDWVRDTSNLGEYYIKYDTDPKKCIKCSVKDVGYIEDTCAWKETAIFIPNNEMVVKYLKHFKILPELKNGNIDYYLSVMTLMPPQYGVNNVAVLDIIGGNPTSFEVDCDVLNAIEYFHDKYNNKLHIRSIGVLKKDVIIYALNNGSRCGAFKILRNDIVKDVIIQFISVKTNIDKKGVKIRQIPLIDTIGIRELLAQALINVSFTELNESLDATNIQFKIQKDIKDGIICLSGDGNVKIADLIEPIYNDKFGTPPVNLYRYYFIPNQIKTIDNLNYAGRAQLNGKYATFPLGKGDTEVISNAGVIAHEFAHNLNLRHIFTPYTPCPNAPRYKAYSTVNIMDYGSKYKEFYYWQWKILNPNIK
jgi:hypothetical protein